MLHLRRIARPPSASTTFLARSSIARPARCLQPRPLFSPSPWRFSSTTASEAAAAASWKRIRYLRTVVIVTTFLGLGVACGNIVRFTVVPPPMPEPGTDLDIAFREALQEELDALPIIERLRRSQVESVLDGNESPQSADGVGGGWTEVTAISAADDTEQRLDQLLTKMRGASDDEDKHLVRETLFSLKGLGPQRRFYNATTGESVTVFWFGGGMTGWPGVAHGGAISMVFLEAFERTSALSSGPASSNETLRPADFTLTYLAPTLASSFFVLRASRSPAPEPGTELSPQKDMTKRRLGGEGEEWSGTLETAQGKVCVKAKAILTRI